MSNVESDSKYKENRRKSECRMSNQIKNIKNIEEQNMNVEWRIWSYFEIQNIKKIEERLDIQNIRKSECRMLEIQMSNVEPARDLNV